MTSPKLRVFVSSKMEELSEERRAVKAALNELRIDGWVFEKDAGARPKTIQQTYIQEVEAADLYIGLFWKGYGNYTIEEYEHAQKSDKDCLIYEKRTDIENQRDPQLKDFLDRISKVKTGQTIRWFNTPDELETYIKEDVARWQTEAIRRNKVSGASIAYQNPLPPDDKTRQELSILASKVKHFWINGVLEHSLHDQVLIELRKKAEPGAVEHPWETVLELPHNRNSSTLTNKPIQGVFEDVGRLLLILGAPGSGKTITLLDLARDLLIQHEKNASCVLPTVFNLSSWAEKQQPLIDWLIDELKSKYQIPKKNSLTWLEQHRLLPLLDGLDEVKSDKQAACVDAINEFIQEYPSGVVVCSRLQEYTDLPVRLKLNGAICIQPLSLEQTDEYLKKAGTDLAALREALKKDQNLQDIIKTPLMLSIMSLAYLNQSVEALSSTNSETIESRRSQVFDTYIERMFQRKGKQNQSYAKDKVNLWLRWLARRMQARSESIFMIEQLQPDWLSTSSQQVRYLLLSRLAAGVSLGVGAGLPIGLAAYISDSHEIKELLRVNQTETISTVLIAWVASSFAGLSLGLLTGFIDILTVKLNRKYQIISEFTGFRYRLFSASMYVVMYTTLWAMFYLVLWFYDNLGSSNSLIDLLTIPALGLLFGIGHWFILGSRSNWQNASSDIRTVERLSWTWSSTLRSAFWWTTVTFIVSLSIHSIIEINQLTFELGNVLIPSVALSLIGGLLGFLIGGFKPALVKGKTSPNEGIKLSIRNAAFGGLAVGNFTALLTLLIQNYVNTRPYVYSLLQAYVVGVSIGVFFGFRYGGYDVIKHYILRLILYYRGYTPKDYVGLLNYAARLVLLQKVGGGYIFIHRLLLEHFAAMENKVGDARATR